MMRGSIRTKIVRVCEAKILTRGDNVGVSFYAFFLTRMMTGTADGSSTLVDNGNETGSL
jgi:hypothetical protein